MRTIDLPPLIPADADARVPSLAAAGLAPRPNPATVAAVRDWLADHTERSAMTVERAPLDKLDGWHTDPITGDIRHASGRFFSIEGLEVHAPGGPVERRDQPIINQPEVGILGILVKDFGGVPHFLIQAKVEPGNRGGSQLSPTVQATKSNYTRVHHGLPVPYLEYFQNAHRHQVVADIRQSEQGAWFLGKRNRNMLVKVAEDVPAQDGFRWLSLPELHHLLAMDDIVNMDTRTVLSCLPFAGRELPVLLGASGDDLRSALLRSCSPDAALHTTREILSWITSARTLNRLGVRSVPLDAVSGWRRTADRITHEHGAYFDIIGVDVEVSGREVARWSQPMLEPRGEGVIAFVMRRIAGVAHVLVRIYQEPGYADVAELGPTVQAAPEDHERVPDLPRPPLLDAVLAAGPERIHFDTVLSEEGGRFHHAQNRYLIVEIDEDHDLGSDLDQFRWMTLYQLTDLLQHSHYLNVEARTLVACMRGLISTLS